MKRYVTVIDGLPFIVKVLLAFPGIDGIVYGIYRIAKGRILFGILWIFFGFFLFWVVDIITLIIDHEITYLA